MSWLKRLKDGLKKTTHKISSGVTEIFTQKKLDDAALEELEDLLIISDMGVDAAAACTQKLRKTKFGQEVSPETIKEFLAEEVALRLMPLEHGLELTSEHSPLVILMIGVNGSGKTTTMAKLAQRWQKEGKSIIFAACDTFRAAAVEQLKVWGERLNIPVISREAGADAAGLAYDSYQKARKEKVDILMIDTAGRLHTNTDLMAELKKICRVLKKIDPSLPHLTLQVLDATTGQNALTQVAMFQEAVPIDGLIMTKIDGSAKGGILVQLASKYPLPLFAIGVGEQPEDCNPFLLKPLPAIWWGCPFLLLKIH